MQDAELPQLKDFIFNRRAKSSVSRLYFKSSVSRLYFKSSCELQFITMYSISAEQLTLWTVMVVCVLCILCQFYVWTVYYVYCILCLGFLLQKYCRLCALVCAIVIVYLHVFSVIESTTYLCMFVICGWVSCYSGVHCDRLPAMVSRALWSGVTVKRSQMATLCLHKCLDLLNCI